MNILFIVGKEHISGPQVWKNGLINALKKKKHTVIEIGTSDISNIKINELKYDIIHTYSQSALDVLTSFTFKAFNNVSHVHTIHGDYFKEIKSKKGIKKILWLPANNFVVNRADLLTFPSEYMLKTILLKRNIFTKMVIIPNGIDVKQVMAIESCDRKRFGLKTNDFLICEVTNFNHLDKAKGVIKLIEAVTHLNKTYGDIYLYIIGDGKYLANFASIYSSKYVKFLGFRNDVVSLIKMSNVFAHITFLDNFPYAILEAMACRKPIIATDIGGIGEMVDDCGLLITDNSSIVKNIINNIALLYNSPSKIEFLSKKSFERSLYYDWDNVVEKFIGSYYDCIAKNETLD